MLYFYINIEAKRLKRTGGMVTRCIFNGNGTEPVHYMHLNINETMMDKMLDEHPMWIDVTSRNVLIIKLGIIVYSLQSFFLMFTICNAVCNLAPWIAVNSCF